MSSDNELERSQCPECGSVFNSVTGMRIHYGKSHDGSIAGEPAECHYCGETFRRRKNELKKREKNFCSQECQAEWRSENFTGEDNPAWKGGPIETGCAACGTTIEVMRAKYYAYNRHFCSGECSGEWFSENHSGPDHTNYKGKITADCAYCGEMVSRYPSRSNRHDRFFCSRDCLAKWQSENWSDVPDDGRKYGHLWYIQRRKAIKRDGEVCQECGLSNAKHREKYGVSLTVHHIKPARNFDTPEEAHQLNNLVTLCSSCHRKREPIIPTSEGY